MDQKQEIFRELHKMSSPATVIEFVYFGFTDTYCYDLRREVICSCNKRVFSKNDRIHLNKTPAFMGYF